MNIVINDANILIDLVHLNLVDEFIQLDFSLKTTDFVFEELNSIQQETFREFVDDGRLELIITESDEDFTSITEILEATTGLSFEDCSVWHYAHKLDGILLSGDGRLRKQATDKGISVKGILFIFDQLLLSDLITFDVALEKIEILYTINSRLPNTAKDERIARWKSNKHHH